MFTFFNNVKGIFRDHSRDNALNFHKIRDFCILVMVYKYLLLMREMVQNSLPEVT